MFPFHLDAVGFPVIGSLDTSIRVDVAQPGHGNHGLHSQGQQQTRRSPRHAAKGDHRHQKQNGVGDDQIMSVDAGPCQGKQRSHSKDDRAQKEVRREALRYGHFLTSQSPPTDERNQAENTKHQVGDQESLGGYGSDIRPSQELACEDRLEIIL